MAHSHQHHSHSNGDSGTAFLIGIALNLLFVIAEGIVGISFGSLALLADAGHNLSDVLGLVLAWGANVLGKRTPSARFTYGLRRSSILAALLNALLLLVAVGAIAWEALRRLNQTEIPNGNAVIVIAAIGVVINTVTALLFLRGQQHDLNVRGAFLHMAADAAVSLGVVVAGVLMNYTGWAWIDPAVSLVIVVVITWGTWSLLRQSLHLSLDAVPHEIDPSHVRTFLNELPEVSEVHDLHIWALSTSETALTVHLIRPDAVLDDDWLAQLTQQLHDRFGIEHATIQVETGRGANACRLAPDDVV